MDRKRNKQSRRELIHYAMRIKQNIRDAYVNEKYNNMVLLSSKLGEVCVRLEIH